MKSRCINDFVARLLKNAEEKPSVLAALTSRVQDLITPPTPVTYSAGLKREKYLVIYCDDKATADKLFEHYGRPRYYKVDGLFALEFIPSKVDSLCRTFNVTYGSHELRNELSGRRLRMELKPEEADPFELFKIAFYKQDSSCCGFFPSEPRCRLENRQNWFGPTPPAWTEMSHVLKYAEENPKSEVDIIVNKYFAYLKDEGLLTSLRKRAGL